MDELLATNDAVLISFVSSLMKDAGIEHFVADTHMSIFEGSLGIIPRRILVDRYRINEARRIVREAGLDHELKA